MGRSRGNKGRASGLASGDAFRNGASAEVIHRKDSGTHSRAPRWRGRYRHRPRRRRTGRSGVSVNAWDVLVERHPVLQTERNGLGDALHHLAHDRALARQGDVELAKGAIGIFLGADIDAMAADRDALGIATATGRQGTAERRAAPKPRRRSAAAASRAETGATASCIALMRLQRGRGRAACRRREHAPRRFPRSSPASPAGAWAARVSASLGIGRPQTRGRCRRSRPRAGASAGPGTAMAVLGNEAEPRRASRRARVAASVRRGMRRRTGGSGQLGSRDSRSGCSPARVTSTRAPEQRGDGGSQVARLGARVIDADLCHQAVRDR